MSSKKLSENVMGWLGDGLNSDSLASPDVFGVELRK